jgi:hypothetical protein
MFSASSFANVPILPETAPDRWSFNSSGRYITCVGGASGSSVCCGAVASSADPKNPIMLDMVSLIFLEFFGIDVGEHLS